jgi:hypothetical protein
LVGENAFENAVLRGLVEDKLVELRGPDDLESFEVGDPGESGIMSLAAQWAYGSLECVVWIENEPECEEPECEEPECEEPECEEPECEDLCLTFKWGTPEQEGFWYDLDDIFEWDEEEVTGPSAAVSSRLGLITE